MVADPEIRIDPPRVVVEPDGQAQVTVIVTNTGQIVEGFRLTVHGAAADWSEVVTGQPPEQGDPDVLRVYPGRESTATVVFTAPAASAGVAGEVAFAVRAQSVVDPSSSAAAEGDLEVGRVHGLTASITPVTSTGRWSGRHTVKIGNWGNTPATLRLVASDPDDALGFLVSPDRLELPVGSAAVAAVRVRSRRPFLRGTPVRLPFRVVAEPDPPAEQPAAAPVVSDPQRPVLDGALDQRPVLSRGTVALGALGLLVVAAAGGIAVTADPAPAQEPVRSAAVPKPEGPSAEPVDANTVTVRWRPFTRPPDSVLVFRIDPDTSDQDPPMTEEELSESGSVSESTVADLPSDTEVCFELAAVRGDQQSPRTETFCTRTPPPPASEPSTTAPPQTSGTTTTEPTGSGTTSSGTGTETSTGTGPGGDSTTPSPSAPAIGEDEWVLGRPYPQADPGSEPLLEDDREELEVALTELGDDTLHVGVLDSTEYQALGFVTPSDVLYIGPFDSEEAALEGCTELGLPEGFCRPLRPGPRE
ncbi:hypothetical protein ACI782_05800 [Geodermatophilus sp. SYSU D00703]